MSMIHINNVSDVSTPIPTSMEERKRALEAIIKPGKEELRISAEGMLKDCSNLARQLAAGASIDELMKSAKTFAVKETVIDTTKKSLSSTYTQLFAIDGHSDLIAKSCKAMDDANANIAACSREALIKMLKEQKDI